MKIYLVGGAVRDKILNLESNNDRDWVVVGGTPSYFIERGYQQVGKDFPVFLHPNTNEEYALARIERKTAAGHKGFQIFSDVSVTLEQDLSRRDLTINAMALDENNNIIDPFNGQKDCKDKILRHVSPAFIEDPLRCLRLARFAAQLDGFTPAKETLDLCKTMVANGDLAELSKSRIWQEWHKALQCTNPNRFFQIMHAIGALKSPIAKIEFDALKKDPYLRFGMFAAYEKNIDKILEAIEPPSHYQKLARLCSKYAKLPPPETAIDWLKLFKDMDAFRQPEIVEHWLFIVSATSLFKPWHKLVTCIQDAHFQQMQISAKPIVEKGFKGKEIGLEIDKLRLGIISMLITGGKL